MTARDSGVTGETVTPEQPSSLWTGSAQLLAALRLEEPLYG